MFYTFDYSYDLSIVHVMLIVVAITILTKD